MIAKVTKAEIKPEKGKQYTWEFILSAKADPNEIESGRCTGENVDSVYTRLRNAFSEYNVVDVKMLAIAPCDKEDSMLVIDEHVPTTQEEPTAAKATEVKVIPEHDDGLIVLPLEAFLPIQLEA